MNRRNFTQLAGMSGLGLFSSHPIFASEISTNKHNFNLAYAPHLGMFRHHAGNDPIDQLNFMADQGFTAFEDNDMRKREVTLQKKWLRPWLTAAWIWEFL
jgi:hydroxypyruvate isomerase